MKPCISAPRPLTILHTEASLGWGGQEIRILRECLGMVGRGHSAYIAAPLSSNINRKAKEAGIPVIDMEFSKKNPLSYHRMRMAMSELGVDVINTHSSRDSWVGGLVAHLPGVRARVVRTRHISTPISRSLVSRFLYDRNTHAIMTTGEEIRRIMIDVNGYRADKIFSVPTGVDFSEFDPERVVSSIAKKGFTVGMLSVLRSWKGHEFLIRAVPMVIAEIPDASFLIAGEGPKRAEIEDQIRSLGLGDKITLLGHRSDVAGVMKSFDLLVHPSYGHEGVPQSILQAMALGIPVIACDAGAIKEVVIDGETGILIPPRDPALIARSIIGNYRSAEAARARAEAARKLVMEKYSFELMLDAVERVYAFALGRDGHGA